jgi:hypothetical protein
MDANTAIVLAGLVLAGIAWMGLIIAMLVVLVRDVFDVGRRPSGPAPPPRRRRATPRRGAKGVEPGGDAPYRPLSWEPLEGK